MQRISDWEALTDDKALSQAELHLISTVKEGRACILDFEVPNAILPDNRIRSQLLRLLILGGSPECGVHESGVSLFGGWIEGVLDLRFCTAQGQTALINCRFPMMPRFDDSRLKLLSLDNSIFESGLRANRINVESSILLRHISSNSRVDLNSATVGCSLDAKGATISVKNDLPLSMQGAKFGDDVHLSEIKLKGTMDLNGSYIGGQLVLKDSVLDGDGGPALIAQGVKTGTDMILIGANSVGTVNINGAEIGGRLDCTDAIFNGAGSLAFFAQELKVNEGLFLNRVLADGTVFLAGADVSGQVLCIDAKFVGNDSSALEAHGLRATDLHMKIDAAGLVSVAGADIQGILDLTDAILDGKGREALDAQALKVGKALILGMRCNGTVNLTAAHSGVLIDKRSWPLQEGSQFLDGFTYDRIFGSGVISSESGCKAWLEAGSVLNGQFYPQPYTQLANVMRATGHMEKARKILIWRERRLGVAERKRLLTPPLNEDWPRIFSWWRTLIAALYWIRWILFEITTAHGYRPFQAVFSAFVLWIIALFTAMAAWNEGSFAPNSDVILTSPAWVELQNIDCVAMKGFVVPKECISNPAEVWSATGEPGMDWESFSAAGYALDLVIPVLDIGQTAAWAPSKDRGAWGRTLWWGRWLLQASGWIVTLIFAAAVAGTMQRHEEL